MKKIITAMLAASLILTSFVACDTEPAATSSKEQTSSATQVDDASSEKAEEPQEIKTIKYCAPGNEPAEYNSVITEINKKMGEDIGVNIEIEYIPWDAWDQKINMKLTSQESFDLLQIMQTHPKLIATNALTDITSIMEEYGSNYLDSVPAEVIEAAKVDDKLFIMPTYWYEPTHESKFLIRTDIRDEHGFENPESPAEMLDQLEVIMEDWEGAYKPYLLINGTNISPTGSARTNLLHVSYDAYPFIVKSELAIIYDDMTFASWIESPEFKQDANFYEDAYKRGLIYPDVLTLQNSQKNAHVQSGEWYIGMGGNINPTAAGLTEDQLELISFAEEGESLMRPMTIKDTVGVPYTSESPESAVKFMDWLYTSSENYDLFLYGIEGEHYTELGDRHYSIIKNPDTGSVGYSFADWMIGNIHYKRNDPTTILPAVEESMYQVDENAIVHPADSFNFDGTPVEAELANVQTAIKTYVVPIYVGVAPYDTEFENAMNQLRAAGYDEVMAEFEKQYNEFVANLD